MPETAKLSPVPDGVRVGETFLETHKYDDAEKYFHAVLSKDGRQVRALNGLGICYQERDRDLIQATSFFRSAVQIDPGYLKARKNLIVALMEQNLPYAAMDEYVAALKHDPKNGRFRLEYADLLATKLRFPQVLHECREVLSCAIALHDETLFDDALNMLRLLKQAPATHIVHEFEKKRPKKPSDNGFLIKAGVGVAVIAVGLVIFLKTRPSAKDGPDQICGRFTQGTSTAGLPAASRQFQIARLAVYDPAGKTVFTNKVSDMKADEWTRFEELIAQDGKAVFGSPPSISVNRWCSVEFAAGKVTGAASHANAP